MREHAGRQRLPRGVVERFAAEIIKTHAGLKQIRRRQVRQAQTRVIDVHALAPRPAHQAQDQRWRSQLHALHCGRREAVLVLQNAQAVERALCSAAGGKWLVADLRDLPDAAEFVEHRLHLRTPRRERRVEQIEVAERSFDHIVRAAETRTRQIQRSHRRARRQAHLQRQHRRAFKVCLHGARKLAVGNAESINTGRARQISQARQPETRAKGTAHRRAEEAHWRDLRAAQRGSHIDGQHHSFDESGAVDGRAALRFTFCMGPQRGQDGGQRMHHRALMHAVEFLVVDLIGIEQSRGGRWPTLAAGPLTRVAALAPRGAGGAHLRYAGVAAAGKAHAHAVGDERNRSLQHRRRQVGQAHGLCMIE